MTLREDIAIVPAVLMARTPLGGDEVGYAAISMQLWVDKDRTYDPDEETSGCFTILATGKTRDEARRKAEAALGYERIDEPEDHGPWCQKLYEASQQLAHEYDHELKKSLTGQEFLAALYEAEQAGYELPEGYVGGATMGRGKGYWVRRIGPTELRLERED